MSVPPPPKWRPTPDYIYGPPKQKRAAVRLAEDLAVARIADLERWKREAILVLDQWERVFEVAHAHEVARLGESKSAVVLRALERAYGP